MSKFNKRRLPRWAQYLCVVLVAVLASTFLGVLSGGYSNWDVKTWFDKEPNPDNLIKVANYSIESTEGSIGVDVKVNEKGVITLSGKATANFEEDVATMTLNPGTYTLGGCNSTVNKSGLKIVYKGIEHYAGIDNDKDGATFTITEEMGAVSATVYVYVMEGERAPLLPIKPTLAKGEEEINFYK